MLHQAYTIMFTSTYIIWLVTTRLAIATTTTAESATTAQYPPNCSAYHIEPSALNVKSPDPHPKSAIGKVFASLHGELNAKLVPQPSGPACYEWACQSQDRMGQQCRWCLPSVFVGGNPSHTFLIKANP